MPILFAKHVQCIKEMLDLRLFVMCAPASGFYWILVFDSKFFFSKRKKKHISVGFIDHSHLHKCQRNSLYFMSMLCLFMCFLIFMVFTCFSRWFFAYTKLELSISMCLCWTISVLDISFYAFVQKVISFEFRESDSKFGIAFWKSRESQLLFRRWATCDAANEITENSIIWS